VFGKPDESCTRWNSNVRAAVTTTRRPRLLIVSSVTPVPLIDGRPAPPGVGAEAVLTETWTDISATGLALVVIRDTPAFAVDVAECVSRNRNTLTKCAQPRDRALAGGLAQERAAFVTPGMHLIDLNDAICPTPLCAVVIGGTLVYRDAHHLTASYARTLAPRLYEALTQALPARSF
jgi:hypothetical protein